MTLATTSAPRIFGLDLVRALAILLVMVAHFVTPILPQYGSPYLAYLVLSLMGLFGVEVFFALSGFLIGGILLEYKKLDFKTIRTFWIRRWLRTLPLYFFFLIFLWVFRGYSRNLGLLYPFFLHLWDPVTATAALSNYFSPSWSLAIEEWFYLLLPLAFAVLGLTKNNQLRRIIALYLSIVVMAVIVVYAFDINHQAARRVTWVRFDALLVGVLARAVLPYLDVRRIVWCAWVGGVCLIVMFAMWAYYYPVWPETPANSFLKYPLFHMLPLGAACLLPMFNNMKATPSLFTRAVKWIAALSYPIYIIHVEVSLKLEKMLDGALYVVSAFVACFLLAFILHVSIERPIMRWRDRVFPNGRASAMEDHVPLSRSQRFVPLALLLCLCVIASLWSNPRIWPTRFCPDSQQALFRARAVATLDGSGGGPKKLAFETLLACSAAGDVSSYEALGDTMRLGWLGYSNPVWAVSYYEQAANLGSAKGAFEAATAYRTGTGIGVDLPRAAALYKLADERGDTRALREYAYIKAKLEQGLPTTTE